MIWRSDQRSIRRLHLNHTKTRQNFCFSTGWTDASGTTQWFIQRLRLNYTVLHRVGALQHQMVQRGVGALTESLRSTAISAPVSDRMIRRLRRGNHRFIRQYYFSGKLFQRLASFARPINMTPCLYWSAFAILKIYCSQGEKESEFLPFGILFLFIEELILSHPDLRANPNARIHVRQDQVIHMHRLSEYQNTV
jgi:hypothetical protein